LVEFHGTVLGFFGCYSFQNFFDPSTTEETYVVEMRIWCIKIGIVLVLHSYGPDGTGCGSLLVVLLFSIREVVSLSPARADRVKYKALK
jgi:hypothetical protein